MDIGGVMALSLMYLNDSDSSVEQATNACLTTLLRYQNQLASSRFRLFSIISFF